MQNYFLSIVYLSGKREKMAFDTIEKALDTLYKKAEVEKDMAQSIGTSIKNMKIYIKDNGKRKILYSYEEWMIYK